MPVVKIELDMESHKQLIALAAEERRPLDWQAEVMLLRALGRWPTSKDPASSAQADKRHVN
jgi:hypothetical protein